MISIFIEFDFADNNDAKYIWLVLEILATFKYKFVLKMIPNCFKILYFYMYKYKNVYDS